jgi:hypothetical protein
MDMTTLQNLTQEIINAVKGQQEAVTHLNNERTLQAHFDAYDSFDRAINVLAMNNKGDRFEEIENEDGSVEKKWLRKRGMANPKELWNGRIQYTLYKSDTDMFAPKKSPAKASIKASIKSLPQAREFKSVALNAEFKPQLGNITTYKVEGYKFYQKAIVIELVDADKIHDTYLRRESQDETPEIIHLVFRYMPFNKKGQPNPYDGITQLRNFLYSQKFIAEQNPSNIRQALDILTGNTVNFPSFYSLNLTSKSDLMTVFSVYGEFSDFEREFSEKDTSEYQMISEFSPVDADSFEFENLSQEIYNTDSCKRGNGIVINYDCHKEFRQNLPLEYNHISAIFD